MTCEELRACLCGGGSGSGSGGGPITGCECCDSAPATVVVTMQNVSGCVCSSGAAFVCSLVTSNPCERVWSYVGTGVATPAWVLACLAPDSPGATLSNIQADVFCDSDSITVQLTVTTFETGGLMRQWDMQAVSGSPQCQLSPYTVTTNDATVVSDFAGSEFPGCPVLSTVRFVVTA